MLRLRLVVGNKVLSLGGGGGYTSSTQQRGVSIIGEFMSTIQYNTMAANIAANFFRIECIPNNKLPQHDYILFLDSNCS